MHERSPRTVGPYVTLARLGAGGMGEVFLARPARIAAGYGPDDLAAVKVIRNEAAREEAYLRRFAREATAAAAVDSPYAARLVGSDATAELPWLATEFVAGPTLSQAVGRHGRLPLGALTRLGEGMARALAAVHAAGVTHRDLKPSNVLLGADGPKVIDFGVARTAAATTLTSTGRVVGTPGYMSPEHIAGGRHVVPASDVFCLASVLVYAATGEDPFGDGPVAAVLFRVAEAEARLDAVPEPVRPLLAACLTKDPADRPEAAELADRFAALRPAGGADGWPEPVLREIADAERDVRQLCATGAPLLPVPAPPSESPQGPENSGDSESPGGGTLAPHQYPTLGPTTPSASPPPARRTRLRAFAIVAAVAMVGAGLGAYLALRGGGSDDGQGGGGSAAPGPTTTLSPAQLTALAGVDSDGLNDASGYVPQFPAQRPAGWKAWQGRLDHAPMDCSADTRAVVCLRTDGTYEALSPSDGHRLWTHAGDGGPDDVGEAFVGPGGTRFMPGDAVAPQSRGGRTVTAAYGELRLLDSRSGKTLWKAEPPAGRGEFSLPPLITDDLVVATVGGVSLGTETAGASLRAYDLRDGSVRWDQELSQKVPDQATEYAYGPEALVDGVLYVSMPGGLEALDPRDGGVVGQRYVPGDSGAGGCRRIFSGGGTVQCLHVTSVGSEDSAFRVDRYTPRTLKPVSHYSVPLVGGHDDPYSTVSGTGDRISLTFDSAGKRLTVTDTRTGKRTATVSLPALGPGVSAPLLTDGRAVFADNHALYLLPLDAAGRAGKLRKIPLPGAPGDRDEPQPNQNGMVFSEELRVPQVLLLGGVAHVVFDQGAVTSIALPNG
ncbi:protein kinase [Streptomyces sp. NPDC050145]|uniref:protein kinase domain-containing protein n=1 Tax=Streptomyces sp. NPDC050145 TaxID=3365602 RepID=UPI0037BE1215